VGVIGRGPENLHFWELGWGVLRDVRMCGERLG